jgi:predicted alpha-1,2-mannosidase
MKRIFEAAVVKLLQKTQSYPSLLMFFGLTITWSGQAQELTSPVDLVNPRIGGISHVLMPTFPTVHRPYGMVRFYPVTSPGISDSYLGGRIYGLPLNRPEHRGAAAITVMPVNGMESIATGDLSSAIDRDFEKVTPYSYSVLLEDDHITVDFTPTDRCGFYQFSPESTKDLVLVFQTKDEASFDMKNEQNLLGSEMFKGVRQYVNIWFNRPVRESGYVDTEGNIIKKPKVKGKGIRYFVVFSGAIQVKMNYGVSWIDETQAGRNLLQEIPGWDFNQVVDKGRDAWNSELLKIKVKGGTEDQRITFYTAMYRSMERMVNINEYGRYFSAYNKKTNKTSHNFYVDDWSWDTFRTLHPLRFLISPDRETDMIKSYILMGEQGGWMPTFPQVSGDAKCMIGHHQAAIIADAWMKGIRGFDLSRAYKLLKKNAMEGTMIPWQEGPATELDHFYREKGWFPALSPDETETVAGVGPFEKRQAVAVTLEHAYDDWCLARLAEELKLADDARIFQSRAGNYKNVFNPATGFMSPKKADGSWVEPFDPKVSGGIGCRDYFAEINSWNYSWFVPHDIDNLISLMGGNDKFTARLDQLFEESLNGYAKWTTISTQPDASGIVGQFVMGNEPGFHVPYLYTYAGEPWKTQKRLRQLMDAWFRNDPMGICGDEDGGGLSSWYVFTAMGFYPMTPGNPEYVIGSPIFEEVTIDLGQGKELKIRAPGTSAQNKYVHGVMVNGQPVTNYRFSHKDIAGGGTIDLEMAIRPAN